MREANFSFPEKLEKGWGRGRVGREDTETHDVSYQEGTFEWGREGRKI